MVYKWLQMLLFFSDEQCIKATHEGDRRVASLDGTLAPVAVMLMVTAACGTPSPPTEPVSANSTAADGEGGIVADQVPINQRFRSLDEYLAFLERTQAPVDGPWYRQIRPNLFELVSGNMRVVGSLGEEQPQQQRHLFTREELEKKYGFAK
jgi:hypothetical protein